ncbi:hypothetical protein F8M41_005037 [Gigaspora margarita]|uniref:Uncharacterized protein n=1 Tax=Gigaspora margarita TaxID=4874 RepID=A0A8H4ERY0_GIGMA|nr:hypothetical protein F8M41_005037 [Gigaspora margarita]
MQVNVMVQIPIILTQITCLVITKYDQNVQVQGSQVFSVDNVDSNDYFYLGDNYFAQEGFYYSIQFFIGQPSDDHSTCWGYRTISTPYSPTLLEEPWMIGLQYYTVPIKAQVVPNAVCISMLSIYEYTPYWERWDVIIDTIDPDGYFLIPSPVWAYVGAKHSFAEYAATTNDSNGKFLGCSGQVLTFNSSLDTDISTDPWVITFG